MKHFDDVSTPEIVKILTDGGVGILRTDTIYGLVAQATNEAAVKRIYALKGRDDTKSPIVLIASLDQLFDTPSPAASQLFKTVWPGKVSVITQSSDAPLWITRGNDTVAYRLPNNDGLRALIMATGPLIAPSANRQGDTPVIDIETAQAYFEDTVDFYVNGGTVTDNTPSQLLAINPSGEIERLR